jgi:archaellum biogenesis ATPase FlaH
MSDIKEYTEDIQLLFIRFLISDPDLFARCQNIIKESYFLYKFRPTVRFLLDFSMEYSCLPSLDQIRAVGKISELEIITGMQEEYQSWFLDEFETFCRHRAIDDAIVKSAELLEKKHYGDVENLIKDAVQIGLVKDLGLSYFEDPRSRLESIKNRGGAISTGWYGLDYKLYGGLNRGEITIFAGGSGAGKSVWLQNFAVNWVTAGLNVIYISLELDEDLISKRLDSMFTGIASKDVMGRIDDVVVGLSLFSKKNKPGEFQLKKLPSGVNVNDLRSYIREVEIQKNIKFDCLLVDYLDLMMPISTRINPGDLFIKDKYVSEELRNLAGERNLLCVTASQLNRCLALDTRVVSNGVEIEIKDVQVGDWLDSNEGPVQVYEKLPITKQPVYQIRTKSGKEIVCSGNHKFPVGNLLKTIHSGLSVGDYLRVISDSGNVDDEIMHIGHIGEEETIDINTTGNRLFYANGILTHNSAVEQIEFDHSHIAGGLSKIQTADNVMGIFTTNSMREQGRYQIQLMKTRSSAGVGSKIDFEFNVDTLRIIDLPAGATSATTNTTQGIINSLQRKGVVNTSPPPTSDTVPSATSALNLRDMLRANNGK